MLNCTGRWVTESMLRAICQLRFEVEGQQSFPISLSTVQCYYDIDCVTVHTAILEREIQVQSSTVSIQQIADDVIL